MALTIPDVLRQFKADVGTAIAAETVLKICGYLGYGCRDRILGPVTTVQVFLLQILHGNTAGTALSRLAGISFTAAAYCTARKRLPVALFRELIEHVCDALFPEVHTTGRWRGHRTWTVDGSSFSMPDTPALQAAFGQPSAQAAGCGFPVAHLLALFHAGTGLLLRVVASPLNTHDLRHAAAMHSELDEGDILIADRGFASFAHLALLFSQKMHAVFRCHQRQIVSFRVGRRHTRQRRPLRGLPRSRYVRRLGRRDQLVEYRKPPTKPVWMEAAEYAALTETLRLREVQFVTRQWGHRTRSITLVTTLLDPVAYPADALADLYLGRWQVEGNLRHLKTTMGLEVLHCKTVAGVLKELYMFAIAYNLVRLVMLEASRRQQVPPDRVSFIDALRWLRDVPADARLSDLVVNPARPGRIEPRVRKRRPKEYTLMTKPRSALRNALIRKYHAA
jgi:hypothetical protein